MIDSEFPKSLQKVCVRLSAETADALGGHDAFIVERNTSEVIG